MCEKPTGGVTTVLAMTGVAVWWTVRLAWQIVSVILAALIVLTRWAAPRVWRVTVRVTRAGHRRWVARRAVRTAPVAPVAAIERPVTLADLLGKHDAGVRR